MHRERDDLCAGDALVDLADHFQATQARQHQVDDQHVGLQLFHQRHRFQPIGRLADHRPIAFAPEDGAQPFANQGMVVGQHNRRHASVLLSRDLAPLCER